MICCANEREQVTGNCPSARAGSGQPPGEAAGRGPAAGSGAAAAASAPAAPLPTAALVPPLATAASSAPPVQNHRSQFEIFAFLCSFDASSFQSVNRTLGMCDVKTQINSQADHVGLYLCAFKLLNSLCCAVLVLCVHCMYQVHCTRQNSAPAKCRCECEEIGQRWRLSLLDTQNDLLIG